jgi:hypothetical protein
MIRARLIITSCQADAADLTLGMVKVPTRHAGGEGRLRRCPRLEIAAIGIEKILCSDGV